MRSPSEEILVGWTFILTGASELEYLQAISPHLSVFRWQVERALSASGETCASQGNDLQQAANSLGPSGAEDIRRAVLSLDGVQHLPAFKPSAICLGSDGGTLPWMILISSLTLRMVSWR